MTANGLPGVQYHNAIKSTGNSAVYTPTTNILTSPLTEKYNVGDNIGRGKFAVVKKCINLETGEEVAAKFIKKRRRGKSCREEILREVVMLEMALDHPRLVNLKEVYETQTELILITEYCAGGELFTECILEEKFNEADVRLLMLQILEGLVYLHDKNIVHLDLKPQNILLSSEFPKGSIKICDLGFACLVNTGEDIRDIIGTPDYVAPEVLNYDPLGLYTDMWSLGVLAYVMLTTCSPFAGDDKQETFCNITTVNLDFPTDLFEGISEAAQDFIKKLLIAEPSERMTAVECMQHEWISGVQSPTKQITFITNEDGTVDSLEEAANSEVASSGSINDSTNRTELHEKVKDETSEMSVIEENEGNHSRSSESGVKVVEHNQTNIVKDPSICVNVELLDSEGERIRSISNPGDVSNLIDKGKEFSAIQSEDVQTPDSESSMCISDARLDDDDSGIGTGTETRGESEPRTVSGRSSTDIITDREEDTDIVEDLNIDPELEGDLSEDQEMLSKSLIEQEIHSTQKGNEFVQELGKDSETTNSNNPSVQNDPNRNKSTNQEVMDDNAEMEYSDITEDNQVSARVEHSNTVNKMMDKGNVNHDTSIIDTNENRIPDEQPMDQTSPSSIRKLHITVKDIQKDIVETKFASTGINSSEHVGRSSNDIVHTIPSSGEKHKRVMCNPSSSKGADNSDSQDPEEYEFVSVSKRVKSYEESLTVTKSPQFSPKLQRSPRIGRHTKSQHH